MHIVFKVYDTENINSKRMNYEENSFYCNHIPPICILFLLQVARLR